MANTTKTPAHADDLDDATLQVRFQEHVAEWKAARGHSSSINAWAKLPSYRAIIDLGAAAVPLLLQELEREPDHWFWALKEISGENPVTPESRGNVAAMAKCWVDWGKSKA